VSVISIFITSPVKNIKSFFTNLMIKLFYLIESNSKIFVHLEFNSFKIHDFLILNVFKNLLFIYPVI